MHINEQYHDLPLLETQTYQFIGREGEILTKEEQVLNEHLIDVYLNDQLTMKLICLPQHLTELVLGRLLTEHIIQSIDDVEQIYICEYGKRAKVYLKQSQTTDAKKNTSFVETTFATHSCLLARRDEILFSCEDIGRHNALDKVIGYALRHQIDLTECMVYSSGRIPTDMAMKAIYAGIPVLSSKASPTTEAIELAKAYRLTLVCAARRDRMKVFSQV